MEPASNPSHVSTDSVSSHNRTYPIENENEQSNEQSAFQKMLVHRSFHIRGKEKDPLSLLQKYQERIKILLQNRLNKSPIKYYISMKILFSKLSSDNTPIKYSHYFHGKTQSLLHPSMFQGTYENSKRKIYETFDSHMSEGSNFTVEAIQQLNICSYRYNPIYASSYLETPKWIANKKCIINIKNRDGNCFEYSILAGLYCQKGKSMNNMNNPNLYVKDLGTLKGVKTNMRVQDIAKFEKENNLAVSVYTVKQNGKIIYPLYITKLRQFLPINLLLIEGEEKNHYTYIKSLNRLLHKPFEGTKVFCPYCCVGFLVKFNGERNLQNHIKRCREYGAQRTEVLNDDERFLKFKDYSKCLKAPFVIYCDFETLNVKLSSTTPNHQSFTEAKTLHEISGYCFYTVSPYFPPKLNYYRGKDAGKIFLTEILNESKRIDNLLKNVKEIIISEEEEKDFANAKQCHICKENFNELSEIVRDHDHITGSFRGAAHSSCNIMYRLNGKIPVFFHNLSGYDSHLIFQNLTQMEKKIEPQVVAKSMEKFITFSLKNLQFKDSLQFLNSSLETLVSNLKSKLKNGKTLQEIFPNLFQYFKDCWSHVPEKDFHLLTRKLCYPYKYIDSFDKFEISKLPSREVFYNDLSKENISDEDYSFLQELWSKFKLKNMGQMHDLYVITDTILLSDIFEKFRNFSLKNYSLDPAHFTTAPSLSWSAALYITKQTLEIPSDRDMHMFFDQGLRGGISMVSHPYAKANHKGLDDYNPHQEDSYIMYFDAINLYGHSMREFLPTHGFEWMDVETKSLEEWNDFILNQNAEQDTGYIFLCDLSYPTHLHDDPAHNNLPLAPTHFDIKADDLSNYQKSLANSLNLKIGGSKLCLTLHDKFDYVTHYQNLKFYIENGLILKKVHKVLRFHQSPWLRKYIDLNTSLRQSSDNKFEANFAKLMNNSFFGKTAEDTRKYKNIKIAMTAKRARKLISKPTFEQSKIYEENLVAFQLKQEVVKLSKPRYIGLCVLELSKIQIFRFNYNFMMKEYPRSILLFTDTDSLCYWIPSKSNIYEEIRPRKDIFDFSNYEKSHPNYDITNKMKPGKFKDEMGGSFISEFCGLRSKMYSLRMLDGAEKKVAKGVLSEIKNKQITHENYKTVLFNKQEMTHTGTKICQKDHQLYTADIKKTSLSPYNDKKYIIWNGVEYTTLSFGHYKTLVDNGDIIDNNPIEKDDDYDIEFDIE